jgi:hypothetical protein
MERIRLANPTRKILAHAFTQEGRKIERFAGGDPRTAFRLEEMIFSATTCHYFCITSPAGDVQKRLVEKSAVR